MLGTIRAGKPKFTGSMTALITPFDDEKLDLNSFKKIVNTQIENGTDGLVPVGTTGESPTLSHEEHEKVVEVCIEINAGRSTSDSDGRGGDISLVSGRGHKGGKGGDLNIVGGISGELYGRGGDVSIDGGHSE